MVIYDFDIRYRVFAFQAEADTILLIDTNAVLSLSIAAKLLQTIGGRNTQIFQTGGVIEHDQFAKGNFLNALRELCRKALMIYFFCFLTGKLHAQTSTSWILCAALNESSPIGLRRWLDLLDFHSKILYHINSIAVFRIHVKQVYKRVFLLRICPKTLSRML